MNCPTCGAGTSQQPNGSWRCNNCGWASGYAA
jgi:hypothetical protein